MLAFGNTGLSTFIKSMAWDSTPVNVWVVLVMFLIVLLCITQDNYHLSMPAPRPLIVYSGTSYPSFLSERNGRNARVSRIMLKTWEPLCIKARHSLRLHSSYFSYHNLGACNRDVAFRSHENPCCLELACKVGINTCQHNVMITKLQFMGTKRYACLEAPATTCHYSEWESTHPHFILCSFVSLHAFYHMHSFLHMVKCVSVSLWKGMHIQTAIVIWSPDCLTPTCHV